MIFSKRVLLMDSSAAREKSFHQSFHHERALVFLRFDRQAWADIFDDLFLLFFAAGTPAARAGELLDATAKAIKTQDLGRMAQLRAQFVAQAWKEKQLQAVGGFARDIGEIGFEGRPRARAFFSEGPQAPAPQGLFQCRGKF